MRQKTAKTVVTFASTVDAMAMEAKAREVGLPGRVIPVPSQISAGCGLSWCVDKEYRQKILTALDEYALEHDGVYEVEMY